MKWEKERFAVIAKAREAIREYSMLEAGERVVVAVSGGGDSLVLLDVMAQLAEEEGVELVVVHIDHGLRPESGEEAAFVAEVASHYRLPCRKVKVEVPPPGAASGMSPEEAARQARYRAFEEQLRLAGAARLATGHPADDRVETLLLRLLAGTGSQGLASIAPVRFPYIRPLIKVWRKEVEAYAPYLPFVPLQDPTNLDTSIPRNRVRHLLLPLLEEEYNPSVRKALLREAEVMAGEAELLRSLVEGCREGIISASGRGQEIDVEALLVQPLAMQRLLLARSLRDLGLEPGFELVEGVRRLLALPGNPRLDLSPDLEARRMYGRLVLGPRLGRVVAGETLIAGPGTYSLAGTGLRLELLLRPREVKDPAPDRADSRTARLDADRLAFPLQVRGIRPGDRFHPLGAPGRRKLQDFLVDLKIPREERGRIAVLESEGEIAWVLGLRIDDRFKVVEETSRVAELKVKEAVER
jgi:tRNA(Ile)-lysidine synthase